MRDLWLSDYQVNWVNKHKNISSLSMMPSK